MSTNTTNLSPNCHCEVTTGDQITVSLTVHSNPVWTTTVSSGSTQSIIPASMSRDNVTIADNFTVNYIDSSNVTVSGIIFDHESTYTINSVKVL
jgi:hypothetical protein